MKVFPTGIPVSEEEYRSLLHVVADPERWLLDVLQEKARLRKAALVHEWWPRLGAAESVPSDNEELIQLILARPDYKTRTQQDTAAGAPTLTHNKNVWNGRPGEKTKMLFPAGFDVPDGDRDCILAYVPDLEDWILGALAGCINKGRKRMAGG